ncbi:Imitation switch two complex protein 1 [Leucoagaricus sp. SymC.cos]|nr:Imitation switch two complex protein 1 [Leucoagaricus sp. SymC.cos]
MPTCRRKRVVLTEPSEDLVSALQADPEREVFYLRETGEIFDSYEAYAARMSFYRLRQFQCEVTGKSGLDYFQAVESERQEARTMHTRFPEPLKFPVLKAVQWQVMGRLDHLVEAVFDRFKDRYFKNEKVLVDIDGVKQVTSSFLLTLYLSIYYGLIERVYPPRFSSDQQARDAFKDTDPSNGTLDEEEPHVVGGDLSISLADANEKDSPELYYYWIHILELEKDKGERGKAAKAAEKETKVIGSVMECQCGTLSRDRLSFSKSILRRFIRDCVDRDAAVASPWTVKLLIAKHYGINTVMPEETRKGVEDIKKGEIDKRKKVWEDREGPPAKKQKKMTAAQEEKAERKEREAQEKAEKERLAKEEAERLAAEKKRKKPVRYPTEDLDIRISDKDKKAGVSLRRPMAQRSGLPLNETPNTFEALLLCWNFLNAYGEPLHIWLFTLDDLAGALQHTLSELPCPLLAEVHSNLVYNLRTVSFTRHSATMSLLRLKETLEPDHQVFGVTIEDLTSAMAEVGNNWERVPLRHVEGREGWEDALVGCLKDLANVDNFPRLREILTLLFFAPAEDAAESNSPDTITLTAPSTPAERYYSLSPEDRVTILSFLCNQAVSSKTVRAHMETCEEALTEYRKTRIDINRLKKQHLQEMSVLAVEAELTPNGTNGTNGTTNGTEEDTPMNDASELSDTSAVDNTSAGKKKGKKQDIRTTNAKARGAARAKLAQQKQALAEHRRLDEEVNKLERRLETIEREFRQHVGGVRAKPLGKDRFYNRIWWFDGLGCTAVNNPALGQYGTGRLFIQGPSEFDMDILKRREEDIGARRLEEEGKEGMLGPGDWAAYSTVEELEEYLAWLNTKGHREVALKTALTKWRVPITAGMKKRIADLNANLKLPDARRSSRNKTGPGYDVSQQPYMQWKNRRALTHNQ